MSPEYHTENLDEDLRARMISSLEDPPEEDEGPEEDIEEDEIEDQSFAEELNYFDIIQELFPGHCASISFEEIMAFVPPKIATMVGDILDYKYTLDLERVEEEAKAIFGNNSSVVLSTIRENLSSFSVSNSMTSGGIDSGSDPALMRTISYGGVGPGGRELLSEIMSLKAVEIDDYILMNYIFKWCEEIEAYDRQEESSRIIGERDSRMLMSPAVFQYTDLHKYTFSGGWDDIDEIVPGQELEDSIIDTWIWIADNCKGDETEEEEE